MKNHKELDGRLDDKRQQMEKQTTSKREEEEKDIKDKNSCFSVHDDEKNLFSFVSVFVVSLAIDVENHKVSSFPIWLCLRITIADDNELRARVITVPKPKQMRRNHSLLWPNVERKKKFGKEQQTTAITIRIQQ